MNNFKGIGWFTLKLYTPTPKKHTTYIDSYIDVETDKKVSIDSYTVENVNIDLGSKINAKVDKGTIEDVAIQTNTKLIAKGEKK